MQYISAEEFLKQPKEVQKAFLDWWQPSLGELFNYKHMLYCVDYVQGTVISPLNNNDVGIYTAFNKIECIPLLTEGQLREFIEDKTGKTLSIMKSLEGKNEYLITLHHLGLEGDPLSLYREYDNLGNDVLQAYWKVACMITKEDKYERN